MKSNLRRELEKVGFDFKNGRIIYQKLKTVLPYNCNCTDAEIIDEAIEVDINHPFLDMEFDDKCDGPEMPSFVAEDNDKIYFPCLYEFTSYVGWVYKDINRYKEDKILAPFVNV